MSEFLSWTGLPTQRGSTPSAALLGGLRGPGALTSDVQFDAAVRRR